ncbi:MAG: L,D-transpeptidase family protein [Gammaproteobacteria bacterium]|nr:L,D-transpeptidase family protein [Gammaproteobacteria bacterium]
MNILAKTGIAIGILAAAYAVTVHKQLDSLMYYTVDEASEVTQIINTKMQPPYEGLDDLSDKYGFDLERYLSDDDLFGEIIQSRGYALLLDKSDRTLSLVHNGVHIDSWQVVLGHNPDDRKVLWKDGATPEGVYTLGTLVRDVGYHPPSGYITNYPNAKDKQFLRIIKDKGLVKPDHTSGIFRIHQYDPMGGSDGSASMSNTDFAELVDYELAATTPLFIVE